MKQARISVLKFFTVCLFFLMLFCAFIFAWKGTSQSHFDIPENRKTHVLPTHTPSPLPTSSPDPAALFREERNNQFREIADALTQLANDTSASAEIRTLSQEKLMEYTENEHVALLIETSLQGMGHPDAVCAVQNGTASVFFSSPISESEGLLLTALIREWTNLPASSIRLIHTQ